MIPIYLRITLLIGILIYYILIFSFLKNKYIELRYTLLWMFLGACFLILVIWPQALVWIIHLFNIQNAMNGLFLIGIAFLLMIVMSLTSIVSRQTNKIRILAQEIAGLEKRIRDLEEKK